MTMKSVGFMLRSDGKSSVKNDFAEVKQAGVDAFAGISDAAEESAAKADAATEKFTQRQIDSFKRQANAAKVAAAQSYNQGAFNQVATQPSGFLSSASVNFDRSTGAARESAAVFEEAARKEEEMAAALLKIRAAIDPLAVAQARYDGELREYKTLLDAGHLSETEHAAAVRLSTQRLAEAKRSLDEYGGAMGLNRTQTMIAQSAVMRFTDSILAGQSPIRAFALEAHKLGEVVSFDDGGVAGGMAKVTALLNPLTIGLAIVTAGAALGTAAWLSYTSAIAKMDAISLGANTNLHATGGFLEASAEAAAKAGDISISAARDIEAGYLKVARSGEVLTGLTAITRDFAAATGQDAKGAQQELNTTFSDAIGGAQALSEKYGLLSQAQVEHIAKLVEEGNQTQAQRALLDALGPAFDGAAEHANVLERGMHGIATAAQDAFVWIGKTIDRLATSGQYSDKLAQLTKQRDNPTLLDRLEHGGDSASFYQKQIDQLRAQAQQEVASDNRKAEVAAAGTGASIVRSYQGDNRDAYRTEAGKLRNALATQSQLDPSQRQAMTETLEAYTHAIDTFIPKQDKANQLAAIDAKIAATKSPAAKAALAAQREQVSAAGEVITSANVTALAHSKAEAAAAKATHTNDAHAKSLARQAEAMEVSARGAIDVANAYLKSSAAGLEAEATRKAQTDATRKGISVEEQVRRQLTLSAAEQVASASKSIAATNDETAARNAVLKGVAAGTIAVDDMNDALKREVALRPLLAARAYLQGDALKALNKVIEAQTKALTDSTAAMAKFQAAANTDASEKRAKLIRGQIGDLSKSPLDRATEAARRSAEQEADAGKYSPDDKAKYVRAKVDEARAGYESNKSGYVDTTKKDQADALQYAERELSLLGKKDLTRTIELDKLKKEQEIRRQFPDMAKADVDAILAGVEAQDRMNERLKVAAAGMEEVRNFGDQLADDLLDPDKIKSWGDVWNTVINDVKNELIKLLLLNPLKNLINGNNDAPTISSVLGNVFGGGSSGGSGGGLAGIFQSIGKLFGHNASGTENWSGGMTYVNENGGEVEDLPSGTRIYPAAESRRMMAQMSTPNMSLTYAPTIDARGADAGRLDQLERQLRQDHQEFAGKVMLTIREGKTRNFIR